MTINSCLHSFVHDNQKSRCWRFRREENRTKCQTNKQSLKFRVDFNKFDDKPVSLSGLETIPYLRVLDIQIITKIK